MHNRRTPAPPAAHRLTRSSRERLWAGVAGGMAEYFDVDPTLVRVMWVATTIFSGGVTVPLYIALWFLMPRDDESEPLKGGRQGGQAEWRHMSRQFEREVREFTADAHRMAGHLGGDARRVPDELDGWESPRRSRATTRAAGASATATGRATSTITITAERPDAGLAAEPGSVPAGAGASASAATAKGKRAVVWREWPSAPPVGGIAADLDAYVDPDVARRRRVRRSAGLVLIALGVLVFAGTSGVAGFVPWGLVWPLIVLGVGVALLLRQQALARRS